MEENLNANVAADNGGSSDMLSTNSTTAKDVIKKYRKKNPFVIITTILSWLAVVPFLIIAIGILVLDFDAFNIFIGVDGDITFGEVVAFGEAIEEFFLFWCGYWIIIGILGIFYTVRFAKWIGKYNVDIPVVLTNSKKQPTQRSILTTIALYRAKLGAKIFYIISSALRFVFGAAFLSAVSSFLKYFLVYSYEVVEGNVGGDTADIVIALVLSPYAITVYLTVINMIIHSIVSSAVIGGMRKNFEKTIVIADRSEGGDNGENGDGEAPQSVEAKPVAKAEEKKEEEISDMDLSKLLG